MRVWASEGVSVCLSNFACACVSVCMSEVHACALNAESQRVPEEFRWQVSDIIRQQTLF